MCPERRNPDFSEERIEQAILGNLEQIEAGRKPVFTPKPKLQPYHPHPKYTGFLALYFHYCYLLGRIEKRQYPPRMTPLLRKEIMKADVYKARLKFLQENNITTADDLTACLQQAENEVTQLAKQRTGANDQNSFYKLNPDVSDLPDKLAKNINGVKLLVMGTVDTGGSGCVCPEHVMLKAILTNLVFRRDDVVIMDMEAGLEHLGRGTASMMDQFIVVIEPGARSVQTYVRIKELAKDIGVTKVRVVANKIRDESDREFIRSRIPADDLLGFISYSPTVIDADRKGLSPYDCSPDALDEIRAIKAAIDAKE